MHLISRGDNNGLVYRNEQMNAMGQVEQFWYGNDVRTTKAYHPDDHLTNLSESFEYDLVYSRLTKVTGFHGAPEHHIAYTSFNKVKEIIEGDRELTITYGPDYARRKRVTKEKGNTLETKYYSGNYEKVVREGSTEERHYIAGNEGVVAVYVMRGDNTSDMYYLHKDHLGSIMEVTDATGSKVPEGCYNRYSYCLNNPLNFVDPGGYEYEDWDDDDAPQDPPRWYNLPDGIGGYFFFNLTFWGRTLPEVEIIDQGRNNPIAPREALLLIEYDVDIHEYTSIVNNERTAGPSTGDEDEGFDPDIDFGYDPGDMEGMDGDGEASGQGGNYSWAQNTQTGIGAFDIGNSVKGGMIDYAVASSAGKSMNYVKRADYVAALGKTAANYVRGFKVAGGVTFVASTGIPAGLMINYYNSGGTGGDVAVKSGLDITMGIVGLVWPIGTGISATYFIIDAATNGFGGYGDPLKIKK